MVKSIPDSTGRVALPDAPDSMVRATVERVVGAAPTTIRLSIHNTSGEPVTLNKTSACWRGQIGSDVFVVFPECGSEILDKRIEYIGPYVNYANDNGENEFVLQPDEAMVRELSFASSYDLERWRKKGCSRFILRYQALHRLPPNGKLATVESAPLLIEV